MADVPSRVIELVETFDRDIDTYRSSQYNETQLRREFIDPLFEQLGWDVANKAANAHAYKDVIHEDAISVGSATKAPDYCFRIGGTRKFFLEAKKPSVNIKGDPHPAYQLRRYAWSAKLPLSILTDFEEFAVYDSQIKPNQKDGASVARIMYFTYKDYLQKWDRIAEIFSKDAILKGSFDKFTASAKGKRGTTTVDVAFLAEIEKWRDMLAKIIALRNRNLSQPEINFAVQCTIDRILFLRMCEDRGIERYGQLQSISSGDRTYPRLCEVFEQADQKYNSGLFHFEEEPGRPEPPDKLTPGIAIDDKDLKWILYNLYYPQCPYEFSVLPPEILGNVYEQFLGKVITLTPAHYAKIEDKPEVKKAGGVYYTPSYIVDYIVKNTVGKLVEAKTPKQIENIKILDPACGSGSFLLGAYTYLLNYHRDWYVAHNGGKNSKKIYQGRAGHQFLTIAEKKRILLNNIFGVDIDSQAVEVTKLSLLLKVLEDENSQTLENQYRLFHERALPDLAANIKCGNSLIAPDFFDNNVIPSAVEESIKTTAAKRPQKRLAPPPVGGVSEQSTSTTELYKKINPFDWQQEFPQIFNRKNPGFDAVIGNPPYGMLSVPEQKAYFENSFQTVEGRFDNYELFIEKGITLCGNRGLLGYIVPSPLLTNLYTAKLRTYLLDKCTIREITNFGIPVFLDPTVHTCIVVIAPTPTSDQQVAIRRQVRSSEELGQEYDYSIPQSTLGSNKKVSFDIFIDHRSDQVLRAMSIGSSPLGDICFIRQCIKTGNDREYVKSFPKRPPALWKPTLRGRGIVRYAILERDLYVKYGQWLARNWKNSTFYEPPKIAIRETGSRIVAALDLESRYFLSSLYAIYPRNSGEPLTLRFILAILNSRLATYFLKMVALELTKGAFTKMRTNQLARLPIRIIDFDNPDDKAMHDKMVKLVDRMLDLHKELAAAKVPDEKTKIQRQIDTTDRQIDHLVYELYNLTDEEIKIIEGAERPVKQ